MLKMSRQRVRVMNAGHPENPITTHKWGIGSVPLPKTSHLFQTLLEHDRATAEHSLRVREYALWLAEEFGLGLRERKLLNLAALMHDVGKICLPGSLLNKPGKLSQEEYRLVQTHPMIGESMLRALLPGSEVLAAVRWHHERPDGRGYPDGLGGERIPLLARFLAVADSFDAMTMARAYCPALPWSRALATLRCCAGSQFDAEVVECFATALPHRAGGGEFAYQLHGRVNYRYEGLS